MKKYCMDCAHYIPGGVDHNCKAMPAKYKNSVCAIREACHRFKQKEGKQ